MNFYNLFKFSNWDGFPLYETVVEYKKANLLDVVWRLTLWHGGQLLSGQEFQGCRLTVFGCMPWRLVSSDGIRDVGMKMIEPAAKWVCAV